MTSIPRDTTPRLHSGDTHLNNSTAHHATHHGEAQGTTPARTMMQQHAETSSQSCDSPDTSRRKRLSFFGRSNSDASTKASPRPLLQPAISTPRVPMDADTLSPPIRPSTSNSEHRRRTTDPLESIRNSIFGGRKNAAITAFRPLGRRSRFSHSVDQAAHPGLVPFASPLRNEKPRPQSKEGLQFKNEKEFYHHRKKSSISHPFNFKHVKHTSKTNLPQLDTVDEKELQLQSKLANSDTQFLTSDNASNTIEQPSNMTNGKAAETANTTRPSQDETRFDETKDTKFNPDEHFHSFGEARSEEPQQIFRSPRHSTSTPVLNSPSTSSAAHTTHHLRTQSSHDELSRSPPSMDPPDRANVTSESKIPATLTSAKIVKLPQRRLPGQPLPAVPPQAIISPQHVVGTKASKSSMGSSRRSVTGLHPAPLNTTMAKPASVRSKRSSKSAATSKSSGSRRTDILDEPNWEDDIDFAFEQGAEAMCDFDWDSIPITLLEEEDEDDEEEVVAPLPPAQASPESASSPDSQASGGVRLSQWANPPSEASLSQPSPSIDQVSQQQRKRGSSVGHRGFLAARSASTDALQKTPPLNVEVVNSNNVSSSTSLPPTFSLTGADAEVLKSPSGSTSYFPAFDGGIPEYLSDPESTRTGGSRHRKSSSYGSYTCSDQSLRTASDTTRWSSASTSSVPDLLHSAANKRKSRSSASRGMSRPLESVPHSPDAERGAMSAEKTTALPGARPPHSDRASSDGVILMRRPATTGDRTLLFTSGRVCQRGRSTTPNRMAIKTFQVPEQEGGWI